MCNTGNKIVISQLQNTKSNFPKFCKVYIRQNQKNKYDTFTYTFSRSHCFNSSFKSCFQGVFWLKLFILKNTLHAHNPLIPRGSERPHILK